MHQTVSHEALVAPTRPKIINYILGCVDATDTKQCSDSSQCNISYVEPYDDF